MLNEPDDPIKTGSGGRWIGVSQRFRSSVRDMTELTPSRLLWALIAVASLWLVGLVVVGVGFVLSFCLGAGCEAPAPTWVFAVLAGLGLGVMLSAGPLAIRMTGVRWAWVASFGGPAILAALAMFLRAA